MDVVGRLDGRSIHEVRLRSRAGAEMVVMEWGAVVRDLVVPTSTGRRQRVVLGLSNLDDYIAHSPHFGAIAGRYANRVAGGRFAIDGRVFQLDLNQNGRHTLHGGAGGFGVRPWRILHHDERSVLLTFFSPDGDQGFPGDLTATCRYSLEEPATLRVELSASTNAATIVNLCHHSYFNLDASPSILDHALQLDADFVTPVDDELIPTGEIRSVGGTAFDFREARPLRLLDERTGEPTRYDHNFVLTRERSAPWGTAERPLARAARLTSPRSGVAMDIWTTEPGLQVYDGHKCDVPVPGLDDARYGANAGICFEPQIFPDSPNRAHFPSPLLRPGQDYAQTTEYRFGAAEAKSSM